MAVFIRMFIWFIPLWIMLKIWFISIDENICVYFIQQLDNHFEWNSGYYAWFQNTSIIKLLSFYSNVIINKRQENSDISFLASETESDNISNFNIAFGMSK